MSDRKTLTVGDLRKALADLPEHWSVQLVVDRVVDLGPVNGASFGYIHGKCGAAPLVRTSGQDDAARQHERVWLYGEGPTP